jgi:predicted TIM-barrel fold metal-dependent hydrolase
MPLSRLRRNASDLCTLLKDFPDTPFVLMHIGYPYQDEFVALAKHYRNAYIDMCWAWIINPAASVRFLKEFLLAAPANKLFAFGGDYIAVENVHGHSVLARRGIAQALSELVAEGWIGKDDVRSIATRIMRGNALELFPSRTGG